MSEPRLRFLTRQDVLAAGGGDFAAAVEDVTRTLALLRTGQAEMPPETSVPLGVPPQPQARAYALPARVGRYVGVKWTAHRPPGSDNAPGILSMTIVNDAATGLPLGIVESALLTAMRTAAVSALALRHAASRPVRRVAVLGAGMQAQTHLRMLAALFPGLDRVSLWNRTPGRAGALAATIEAAWPLTVAATLDDAVADANAVIACTAAPSPFLRPDHVVPGRIIIQVGYHEATFEAIERADAVIVDLWGEFRLSSAKSLFQMHRAGRFDESRVAADLGAVVLDGWRPPQDASVFFSSFGLNVFDIALAARVLRQADGEGPGRAARD